MAASCKKENSFPYNHEEKLRRMCQKCALCPRAKHTRKTLEIFSLI
jgi:hypothetical protein